MIEERESHTMRALELAETGEFSEEHEFLPLAGIGVADYEELQESGVLNEQERRRLEDVDMRIEKMKEGLSQQSSQQFINTLEKLGNARLGLRADLAERIDAARDEQRTEYADLTDAIQRISEMPHVKARLEKEAQESAEVFSEKRAEEKQKAEEERKHIENETEKAFSKGVSSLSMRHENSRKALETFTEQGVMESLIALHDEWEALQTRGSKKEREEAKQHFLSEVGRVRASLEKAIIEGEGDEQIHSPSQVVPWISKTSKIDYTDSLDLLRNMNARDIVAERKSDAEDLISTADTIDKENAVFRKIFGKRYHYNHETHQKEESSFWMAFRIRKNNDASGETKRRKEAHEQIAKSRAVFEKDMKPIIEKGGFSVRVPQFEKKGRKSVMAGYKPGGMVLSVRLNKKNVPVFEVAETVGACADLKGNVYTESSLPAYISKALGSAGIEKLKAPFAEEMKEMKVVEGQTRV